jgi:hypothetical protein
MNRKAGKERRKEGNEGRKNENTEARQRRKFLEDL